MRVVHARVSLLSFSLGAPRARLINNAYLTNSPSRPAASAPAGRRLASAFENLANRADRLLSTSVFFILIRAALVNRNEIFRRRGARVTTSLRPFNSKRDFALRAFGKIRGKHLNAVAEQVTQTDTGEIPPLSPLAVLLSLPP